MLLTESMDKYEGKTLSHFEDEWGNQLKDLNMITDLFIVFTDGSKIRLGQDWYGSECYFSQYEVELVGI